MIDLKTTPTEKLRERIAWLDKLRVRSRGLALANATFYRELVAELRRRGELNETTWVQNDSKDPTYIIQDDPFAKPAPPDVQEFMKWFTKTWKL